MPQIDKNHPLLHKCALLSSDLTHKIPLIYIKVCDYVRKVQDLFFFYKTLY